MIDVIVTRHPALTEYLVKIGLAAPGTPVIDHVSDPSVLDGRHVAGVLPLHLASRAASVTEIPLRLTPEDRGKELSLDELVARAGTAVTYTVRRIP